MAPGGTRTYATGAAAWADPGGAGSLRMWARWQARPTFSRAVVFPAAAGPVTISEGRAVVCWWRPRIIRVRTWVASWLMAGVRMVTNAEW